MKSIGQRSTLAWVCAHAIVVGSVFLHAEELSAMQGESRRTQETKQVGTERNRIATQREFRARLETKDVILLKITPDELDKYRDPLRKQTASHWTTNYSNKLGGILIRRRPQAETGRHKIPGGIVKVLENVIPNVSQRIMWARRIGSKAYGFPTGLIYVLFKPGTTEAVRREILSTFPGEVASTVEDLARQGELRDPVPPVPERGEGPGLPRKAAVEGMQKLHMGRSPRRQDLTPREYKVVVPVARFRVTASRVADAFEIASAIEAHPQVRIATPDFHALGEKLLQSQQIAPLPQTSALSVHRENLFDLAWLLGDQGNAGATPSQFLISRERVAVLDGDFFDHPSINFEFIGYDAADGDFDPRTPKSADPGTIAIEHGTNMSGLIGGFAQVDRDEVGLAPGSRIIPFRPSFARPDTDFYQIDGNWYYTDYDQFVFNYGSGWVETILRLYARSYSTTGLVIANMSIAVNRQVWNASNVAPWLGWWLDEGNYGRGVFAAASAGNNPDLTTIASLASHSSTMAVGYGNFASDQHLGNSGSGLDVIYEDGRWPIYFNNAVFVAGGGGGSSAGSASAAALVSLMTATGGAPPSAEELRSIIRLSTRKTRNQLATENGSGWSPEYGFGFIDAHHAVTIAWKHSSPATEAFPVRFRQNEPPSAFVQVGAWPWSRDAGKRRAQFWAARGILDNGEVRWERDHDTDLRHIDQSIDSWGLPYGDITVAGDFDGDGLDEVAVQLDDDYFWPSFSDHPAHTFLVQKYDPTADDWRSFGQTSPNDTGDLVKPQIVWPTTYPITSVFAADLAGNGRDYLIALEGEVINVVAYNPATDVFEPISQIDFQPAVLSSTLEQETGIGLIISRRVLGASPFTTINGKEAVLVIGAFMSQKWWSVRWYVTASVLVYDTAGDVWTNVPLSNANNETHIILGETNAFGQVEGIFVDDFTQQPEHSQAVIHMAGGQLYLLGLHRVAANQPFSGYAVYSQTVDFGSRISPLKASVIGVSGKAVNLAWLTDDNAGNRVKFLRWNTGIRQWELVLNTLYHGRRENRAVDLYLTDIYDVAGNVTGTKAICLLMEHPHRNMYRAYWYMNGKWESIGYF